MSVPIQPGARVGWFLLESELGRGGMGVVFAARDERLGRPVAVKVLGSDAGADPNAPERFRREAKAASRVSHPNVVTVFAAGDDAGVLWIASELVEGGSLAAVLERSGSLPWREAARLGAGIARGLEALHGAGLVHRDVKPANVLLDARGTPKLADLGLAAALAQGESERLTRTGDTVGTLDYMAPEQTEGSRVDARADLYALGATLHALVAGEPPFRGQGYAVLKQKLLDAPPRLRSLVPGVPAELEQLVLRLLAIDPAVREAGGGAGGVARELEALATIPEPARRAGSRRGLAVGLGIAVAAFTLGIAFARRDSASGPPLPSPSATPPAASPGASPVTSPRPAASAHSRRGAFWARELPDLAPDRVEGHGVTLVAARDLGVGWISAVACTRDLVIAGSGDRASGALVLLDRTDLRVLDHALGHPGGVGALVVLPDGTLFSCGATDGRWRRWAMDSRKLVPFGSILQTGVARVVTAAPRDETTVVVAGREKFAIIDLSTGKSDVHAGASPTMIAAVASLPGGRVLAGDDRGAEMLFEPGGGPATVLRTRKRANKSRTLVAATADGFTFTGGSGGLLFAGAAGSQTRVDAGGLLDVVALAVSPVRHLGVTSEIPRSNPDVRIPSPVRLWDLDGVAHAPIGEIALPSSRRVVNLAFGPDGSWFAGGTRCDKGRTDGLVLELEISHP